MADISTGFIIKAVDGFSENINKAEKQLTKLGGMFPKLGKAAEVSKIKFGTSVLQMEKTLSRLSKEAEISGEKLDKLSDAKKLGRYFTEEGKLIKDVLPKRIAMQDELIRKIDTYEKKIAAAKQAEIRLYRTRTFLASATLKLSATFAAVAISSLLAEDRFDEMKLGLEAATGSAKTAGKVFNDLRKFVEGKPIALKAITAGAGTLLGLGMKPKEAEAEIKRLAVVATDFGVPLDRIAEAYAKVEQRTTFGTQQLRQFGKAMFPITKIMHDQAIQFGFTEAEFKKYLKTGAFTTEWLDKSIKKLSENAEAMSLMRKRAETLKGGFTELTNVLMGYGNEFAKATFGTNTLGGAIDAFAKSLQKNKPVVEEFINLLAKGFKYASWPLRKVGALLSTAFVDVPKVTAFTKKGAAMEGMGDIKLDQYGRRIVKHEHTVKIEVHDPAKTVKGIKTSSTDPSTKFHLGTNMLGAAGIY